MKNSAQSGTSCHRAGVLVLPIFFLVAAGLNPRRVSAQDQAKEGLPPPTAAQVLLQNAEVTADGGLNFYTTHKGKRRRSFSVTPQGSLIAGGVSRAGTPLTNEPPGIEPVEYDKAGAGGGRNWIHDFYFGRYEQGEGQPRLHTRGLIMWGRGDSPDIQLGRTGPDNAKTRCKDGKTLVHAAIEGPEAAVYYRGEAHLTNGRAVVCLPEYFEALARAEGRTVMLTNVDGFARLAVQRQDGRQVAGGKFIVIPEIASSSQAFTWEVKAARADIAPLEVEP